MSNKSLKENKKKKFYITYIYTCVSLSFFSKDVKASCKAWCSSLSIWLIPSKSFSLPRHLVTSKRKLALVSELSARLEKQTDQLSNLVNL